MVTGPVNHSRAITTAGNQISTVRTKDGAGNITRVILNVADWEPRPNWLVLPVGYPIDPLPALPYEPIGIALNNRAVYDLNVDFYVLKTGDANGDVGQ